MLDVLEVVDSPLELQNVLRYESDRSGKLLFETGKTKLFGLANRMVRF
jgi:hypothetical protein